MAEQKQMEMLSALMGEEGQDAAKMLLRMQRLQRLLGAPQDTALPPAPQEEADVFSRSSSASTGEPPPCGIVFSSA